MVLLFSGRSIAVQVMEREEYLTVSQVAEMLQMEPESVTKLLRQSKLPGYKIGREWRIDKVELARHFNPEGTTINT
jgi:excisionase family DNA binding protein